MTTRYSEICKALCDDTRQKIVEMLKRNKRMSVNEIANKFNIAQPSISHHLEVLRKVGMVKTERKGQQIIYSLQQTHTTKCCVDFLFKLKNIKTKSPKKAKHKIFF